MYLPDRTIDTQSETAPDKFSLAALIAWLRTKNPAATYCYTDNGRCLIGQYLSSIGIRKPRVDPISWSDAVVGTEHPLPSDWDGIACGIDWISGRDRGNIEHTFGAALSRALSIAGERE
jgi:hypothetical protein